MKQFDFNYVFELNASDLFITQGNKIFFLVVSQKEEVIILHWYNSTGTIVF